MKICVVFDAAIDQSVQVLAGQEPLAVNDADLVVNALCSLGFQAWSAGLGRNTPIQLAEIIQEQGAELVFNLCDMLCLDHHHGPVVPALVELLGAECVGASARGISLLTQKHHVKAILTLGGFPTPKYQVVHRKEDISRFRLELQVPVIVKPTGTHASVGIDQQSVCATEEQTQAQISATIERRDEPVLIEEYVHGSELYVSLQGDPLVPLKYREYDLQMMPSHWVPIRSLESKWVHSTSKEALAVEPHVQHPEDTPLREATSPNPRGTRGLEQRCAEAFRLLGGRDWGRVELRLDKGGIPMIIDVTSNTYLGTEAACVIAAQDAGYDYQTLIGRIVSGAIERAIRRTTPTRS